MKYLTLSILALFLMSCSLFDQDIPASKVPSVVKNTLSTEFPDAYDIDWEKKKGDYEADFEIKDVDHSALFNAKGELLMSKMDIRSSELPAAVTEKIAQDYADYHIDDAEKVDVKGRTLYQVELDGRPRDLDVVYTAEGQEDKDFKYWN